MAKPTATLQPTASDDPSVGYGQLQLQRAAGDVGASASDAREKATVFIAAHLAQTNPRRVAEAVNDIKQMCADPEFAAEARYAFPRKNYKTGEEVIIQGPGVNLARGLMQCWGHMRTGIDIVAVEGDEVTIRGWAWDVQRNLFHNSDDHFKRLVLRYDKRTREKQWIEADEREFRELVNRRGAICERNAILKLLPPHVVAMADRLCVETTTRAAQTDLAKDSKTSERAISNIQKWLAKFGIERETIDAWLGYPLPDLKPDDLVRLREIKSAVTDGAAQITDFFPPEPAAAKESPVGTTGDTFFGDSEPIEDH